MSKASEKTGNTLRIIGGLLLAVWIGGAVIAGMYHNYTQKRQCIEDEGLLKGWLWCSAETRNSFGFNMLRGVIWPIEVVRTSSAASAEQTSGSPRMSQKQFDTSHFGAVYSCWAVALHTERTGDAEAFAKLIAWTKTQDSSLVGMHSDYFYYAALHVKQIETKEGFESYYRIACAEPVARVKQAIDQGMMK